ncbi:hypothetical protein LP419_38725 [Massilia sp. H-1]|nr:hypothetical protein LP419_38725 [Massilia sp. H-1]
MVKLGGGLITAFSACGNAVPVLNRALLVALAGELRALHCPLIVLHGTGTFGKPPALKYGYMDGRLACERRAVVAEVASQLAQMEADVLACLLEGGLHAFRLPVVGLAPRAGCQRRYHALRGAGGRSARARHDACDRRQFRARRGRLCRLFERQHRGRPGHCHAGAITGAGHPRPRRLQRFRPQQQHLYPPVRRRRGADRFGRRGRP